MLLSELAPTLPCMTAKNPEELLVLKTVQSVTGSEKTTNSGVSSSGRDRAMPWASLVKDTVKAVQACPSLA